MAASFQPAFVSETRIADRHGRVDLPRAPRMHRFVNVSRATRRKLCILVRAIGDHLRLSSSRIYALPGLVLDLANRKLDSSPFQRRFGPAAVHFANLLAMARLRLHYPPEKTRN